MNGNQSTFSDEQATEALSAAPDMFSNNPSQQQQLLHQQQQGQLPQLLAAAPQPAGFSQMLQGAAESNAVPVAPGNNGSPSGSSTPAATSASLGAPAPSNIAPAPQPNSQNFFWQQALQSLNFIPSTITTQQQQASFLPVAALNQLGISGAMMPQQQQQQQQAQQQPLAGVPAPLAPTLVPAPMSLPGTTANYSQVATNAIAAPPSSHNHHKRKDRGDSHQQQQQGPAKMTKHSGRPGAAGAPSVVSSVHSSSSDAGFAQPPPAKLSDADLNRMTPAERRRYERNLREQQRSYRISQQIKQLRDVLSASNIPFKPNKFSILVSVADYIKELQARAIMLDADHKRLVDTIRQTNEMVNSGQVPSSSEESNNGDMENNNNINSKKFSNTSLPSVECSPDAMLVQGIDFEGIFRHCPYPLGVASLDGRVLACNPSFERTLGCSERGQMVEQSLFLYIRNHQEIFEAMADLLKRSSAATETGAESGNDSSLLYWCGQVVSTQQQELAINITLTGLPDGSPKFFSFSIATSG